jgi:hypothetical protein
MIDIDSIYTFHPTEMGEWVSMIIIFRQNCQNKCLSQRTNKNYTPWIFLCLGRELNILVTYGSDVERQRKIIINTASELPLQNKTP